MKVIEQSFPVALFIMLYKVVLTFESVDEILKDVRANCLCASLLRTQFMSQRHATSCTSARTKGEIYSNKGMVSIALTSLRFNSLG